MRCAVSAWYRGLMQPAAPQSAQDLRAGVVHSAVNGLLRIDRPRLPSLVEQVHQRLSESIGIGALAPGELVVVDKLAAALGVSKTPVREALRTAVESLAAELIAPGLTDQDLIELEVAAQSARPPDQEFHDVVRAKCRW